MLKPSRIIAIVLSRLEMDINECIDIYTDMSQRIFSRKGMPVNVFNKHKGRFYSIMLEECIKEVLQKRRLRVDEPFQTITEDECKV
jgi:hypothetical protein